MKITISAIKADVGGIGGHTRPSDGLIDAVRRVVKNAENLLLDHYIGYCGDDVHIVMTHTYGVEDKKIHQIAWDAFLAGTEVAKKEGLYGAGQDLLKDSFSGNIKGAPRPITTAARASGTKAWARLSRTWVYGDKDTPSSVARF